MKTYTFEITQTFLEEAEGETFEEALEAAIDKAFSDIPISYECSLLEERQHDDTP